MDLALPQPRYQTKTSRVDGMVKAQYIQNDGEITTSSDHRSDGIANNVAKKVPGRKRSAIIAIAFMEELSFLADAAIDKFATVWFWLTRLNIYELSLEKIFGIKFGSHSKRKGELTTESWLFALSCMYATSAVRRSACFKMNSSAVLTSASLLSAFSSIPPPV